MPCAYLGYRLHPDRMPLSSCVYLYGVSGRKEKRMLYVDDEVRSVKEGRGCRGNTEALVHCIADNLLDDMLKAIHYGL